MKQQHGESGTDSDKDEKEQGKANLQKGFLNDQDSCHFLSMPTPQNPTSTLSAYRSTQWLECLLLGEH